MDNRGLAKSRARNSRHRIAAAPNHPFFITGGFLFCQGVRSFASLANISSKIRTANKRLESIRCDQKTHQNLRTWSNGYRRALGYDRATPLVRTRSTIWNPLDRRHIYMDQAHSARRIKITGPYLDANVLIFLGKTRINSIDKTK